MINCNSQRLTGLPVRGNGKIIQEPFFRGASWNVIKVVGREWDACCTADRDGAQNLMNTTPDGATVTYKANDGGYVHLFRL